jgi:hypothetical protein
LSEQIDVCVFDELSEVDAERGHEAACLLDAPFGLLSLRKNDLELEEIAEVLDPIEVNPGTSDKIEDTTLADAPRSAIGE